MTEKTIIIIGDSVVDLDTTCYGTFHNLIIQSVQGDFNYINIESGDFITFENGFQYISVESTIIAAQNFIKNLNNELNEVILKIQNNIIHS